MLLTWGAIAATPSGRVAMTQKAPIGTAQLSREQANLRGEIVAVQGQVTAIRDGNYVIDRSISASADKVDWPLQVGDKVVIQGYLSDHPARLELKHPLLTSPPSRRASEISRNSKDYHSRFVKVIGRVTSGTNRQLILDEQLAVEDISRIAARPKGGAIVVVYGQLLDTGNGALPRLASSRLMKE
jgi:hypothetical protein